MDRDLIVMHGYIVIIVMHGYIVIIVIYELYDSGFQDIEQSRGY